MSLFIGNMEVKVPVFLAPMAGVTDFTYRKICYNCGSGGSVTELISAKAVLYNNRNTEELLFTDGEEGVTGLQLFGSDPEILGEIAKRLEDRKFSFVDLNMGCPVPKVVRNGEGSALLKEPKLAGRIIESMVKSQSKPVTVKIRSGFDDEHINAPEIAKIAESAGASAVFVHARTREQYYAGEADWEIIRKVKESVNIPIIGNGDIHDSESAKKMIEQTGCDGIMIGRAARGNPWLFGEIRREVYGEEVPEEAELYNPKAFPVSNKILKEMMIYHACKLTEQKGEFTAVREMRKHMAWYTAGIKHASDFRREVNNCTSTEEMKNLVEELFENL